MNRPPERRRDRGGQFAHLQDLAPLGSFAIAVSAIAIVVYSLAACGEWLAGVLR